MDLTVKHATDGLRILTGSFSSVEYILIQNISV